MEDWAGVMSEVSLQFAREVAMRVAARHWTVTLLQGRVGRSRGCWLLVGYGHLLAWTLALGVALGLALRLAGGIFSTGDEGRLAKRCRPAGLFSGGGPLNFCTRLEQNILE